MVVSLEVILLVVSNFCDVLVYIIYKLFGFLKERVIVLGIVLDILRLKYVIGKYLNVNNNNVYVYVLGEYGDSEVVSWSIVSIVGESFDEYVKKFNLEWDDEVKLVIESDVKNVVYEIISRKNVIYFVVVLVVIRIVEVILRDENIILIVLCLMEG